MAHVSAPLLNIRARIERLDKLPPMPEMTQKIIQLNANPDAHVNELVNVIQLDPSLASQVMRYATSPFLVIEAMSIHSIQRSPACWVITRC